MRAANETLTEETKIKKHPTDKQTDEECAYCGSDPVTLTVPPTSDDAAWAELAKEHSPDCEWIATRAHRVENKATGK